MRPILFEYTILGQHRVVAGYGLMVALGVLIGMAVGVLLTRRRGIDVINALLCGLIAIGAGISGSYLLFLITIVPQAIENPRILLSAGLVFYGGPLAAVPAAVIACKRLQIPPLRFADIAAPALALGHALGRMGCFLGGCCYGGKWSGPLAVVFMHPLSPASQPPMPRHPVQMYESCFLLIASLTMILLWGRTRGNGRIALGYVVAYSLWRFIIEMLRQDEIRGYLIPGLITTSQAISLAIIVPALYGLYRLRQQGQRTRVVSPG